MPKPSDYDYAPPCDSKECKPPKLPTPFAPPPSSSPGSHGRATFVTGFIIGGSALAFLIICISLLLLVRRRRRRRRREALLEAAAAPAAPTATLDGDGGVPDPEEAEQGEGEVVHHAWHIRTVGLDEAAIESIALTRYRAGAGASDCAVCLGEFADGELLRLLPRCAHAFHVPCIDTWLRAHVNCPLCRAHVLDTAPTASAAGHTDAADAGQAAVSITGTTEDDQMDQRASEQRELRVQIDRHDGQTNSPEQPHRPAHRNFRRVVSMDSPPPIASAEDERAGGEKKGTGGVVHRDSSSPGCSGHLKNDHGMKRSLSVGSRWELISRHCRRSSSLLPF